MLKDKIIRWIQAHREIAAMVAIYAVLSMLLAADKLIWQDDIPAINWKGWLYLGYSLFPWTLLAMLPLFLFGKHSRWIYAPIIIIFVLIDSIEWFVRINFKMLLDGDCVGIWMGSSSDEVSWFLNHYLGFSTFLIVAILGMVIYGMLRTVSLSRYCRVSKLSVGMAALSIGLFIGTNPLLSEGLKTFERLVPVHLIADSMRNYQVYAALSEMKHRPQLPTNVNVDTSYTNVVGVIVLGESATRSHWGLYGYERDTTPNMSARKNELVVFKDLVAPTFCTSQVIRYLFTTRTVERDRDLRYTMSQILRKSGYDVSLYSNQRRWGQWDGDESFAFAGCDPMLFMNEQGETNRYDGVLLKYLDRDLSNASGAKIVFLHLRGSHVPVAMSYPHEGAPFKPEVFRHSYEADDPALARNNYDNSIWYTDKILEQVIHKLESLKCPCWMIYLSDHGESTSSPSWRIATNRNLWDVPFIIWLSSDFRAQHQKLVRTLEAAKCKPLQTDQLFYGVLRLVGVNVPGVAATENFLSNEFVPRQPRVILGGKKTYEWR